jgi:hypothetical protein
LAGIDTLEAANHFLETRFLPEWEQRFTVTPRNPRNAHRRLGREHRLEEVLSVRVARKVTDDHTVSWDGNRWGVPREEVCAGLRGAQVEIERRLDGTHWLRFRGRYLPPAPLPERTAIGKSFRPTASRTCRSKTKTPRENQTQIPCASRSPLEKTLEADISIWHKPGHFYFALTGENDRRKRRESSTSVYFCKSL